MNVLRFLPIDPLKQGAAFTHFPFFNMLTKKKKQVSLNHEEIRKELAEPAKIQNRFILN